MLLIVSSLLAVFSAQPAQAGDNYPQAWKSKPLGAMFDSWGHATRYCTSWAGWALHDRNGFELPFHDNAEGWGAKAAAAGYAVDSAPAIGAIAWWDGNFGNGYGHVAYVESLTKDKDGKVLKVVISEYNYDLMGNYHEREIDKNNPTGYIHFKDIPTTDSVHPDFNGDQFGDVAWHHGANLTLLMSQGNGAFAYAGSTGGIGSPTWAGAGDVNGDKQVDVIWHTGTTLTVFKWGGGGWSWVGQTTGIGTPDYAVVGDFNGDRRADIAWHKGTTLTLLTGTTGNTFAYGGATGGISAPLWARAGDVTGDGKAEAIWYANNTFTTFGWTGSGWGWVNATSGIGTADGAAVGDFTGDGRTDVAWHQGTTLNLYGGLPDGKFGYVGGTGGIGSGSWTGAADVNKDGKSDVIWYQGTTIYTYGWTGSGWGYMGATGGIGAPRYAVASG